MANPELLSFARVFARPVTADDSFVQYKFGPFPDLVAPFALWFCRNFFEGFLLHFRPVVSPLRDLNVLRFCQLSLETSCAHCNARSSSSLRERAGGLSRPASNPTIRNSSFRMAFIPGIQCFPRVASGLSACVDVSSVRRRRCVPRACFSARTAESRVELWRTVAALRKDLDCAVRAERYGEAADLRDRIESLSLTDDYVRVERELTRAVEEQRFLDAAALRDDLARLTPPPREGILHEDALTTQGAESRNSAHRHRFPADATDAPICSEVVTNGIRVEVVSFHMPQHDGHADGNSLMRYTFGYRVTITNNSNMTVQLISRHWIIENETGPESEVRGSGVVGRQPVLEPGESFEYTSACPLTCKRNPANNVIGNMRGEYQFVKGDTGMETFTAKVGRFYFVLPS